MLRSATGAHQEPCRYIDNYGTIIPYHIFYQTILRPAWANGPSACPNENIMSHMFRRMPSKIPRLMEINRELAISTYDRDAGDCMGLVHKIFCITRASLLQSCDRHPAIPLEAMPRCPTWPGLERWVAQIVACGSSHYKDEPSDTDFFISMHSELMFMILDTTIISSDARAHPKFLIDPQYQHWERTVNLPEVLELVSWLLAVTDILHTLPNSLHFSPLFSGLVEQAMARAAQLGLCPQRVWALASVAPGRELSLLGLVPPTHFGSRGWRHEGHDLCTADYCAFSALNFTSVSQLHLCNDPAYCQLTTDLFPQALLLDAINRQVSTPNTFIPTAWALDGKSIVSEGRPFMAISHVWSDGTGSGVWQRGRANECLWGFWCGIAHQLGCEGIWWDSVCLPNDKAGRIHALNRMHENYSNASITLVHDRYLSTLQWTNAASACFSVAMSTWFTRGWTALELQQSRKGRVHVVFNDRGNFVLKNLDNDILLPRGTPSYRHHQISTALIQKLREPVIMLKDLLIAIGPRSTSLAADKATIAGLFIGIKDIGSMSQAEIYRSILLKVQELARVDGPHGSVSREVLHHGMTAIKDGGFNWCPPDLFKIPTGDGFPELWVQDNGDLLGMWEFRCLNRYMPWISIPDSAHPLIRARLYVALANPDMHILLVESHTVDVSRAIVVRVGNIPSEVAARQWNRESLYCHLVGSVHFRSDGRSDYVHSVQARIGNGLGLLGLTPGEKACMIATYKSAGVRGTGGLPCSCWS